MSCVLTYRWIFQFPCRHSAVLSIIPFFVFFLLLLPVLGNHLCRTSCGSIPINYPFGIDDGCGSPYYRRLLVCNTTETTTTLELRTPSGRYPVRNISYSDPHLLVTDPLMWKCQDGDKFRPTRAFSLDSSTHLSLSPQNDYLFFNCSETEVIVEPKPIYCERFPDRCDSSCDSASYLCRHLPECGSIALSCCSYYPKATESLRMMLRYVRTYAYSLHAFLVRLTDDMNVIIYTDTVELTPACTGEQKVLTIRWPSMGFELILIFQSPLTALSVKILTREEELADLIHKMRILCASVLMITTTPQRTVKVRNSTLYIY